MSFTYTASLDVCKRHAEHKAQTRHESSLEKKVRRQVRPQRATSDIVAK
jgi:hypothetical protein